MNALAIALHLLAAVVWVGGMFFAFVVLRPSAGTLEPPQRLMLWAGVFKRFFVWVLLSIVVLFVSGYWLAFNWFQGMASAPYHVHMMHTFGLLMALLFLYMYIRIYPKFAAAVKLENWADAGALMNRIRVIVLINLLLGLAVLALVGALQRLV